MLRAHTMSVLGFADDAEEAVKRAIDLYGRKGATAMVRRAESLRDQLVARAEPRPTAEQT